MDKSYELPTESRFSKICRLNFSPYSSNRISLGKNVNNFKCKLPLLPQAQFPSRTPLISYDRISDTAINAFDLKTLCDILPSLGMPNMVGV